MVIEWSKYGLKSLMEKLKDWSIHVVYERSLRRDDRQYNEKLQELRKYLPQLEQHLDLLSILVTENGLSFRLKFRFRESRLPMGTLRPFYSIERTS